MQVVAHRPTTRSVWVWIQAELAESGFTLEVHDFGPDGSGGEGRAQRCWSPRGGSACDEGPRLAHWCPSRRDPDHLLPNVAVWTSDTHVWWEEIVGVDQSSSTATGGRGGEAEGVGSEGADGPVFDADGSSNP